MNTSFEKKAGIALILFTCLITVTMIFHPSGGSFSYIVKATPIILISHTIALISLPFACFGFWGLTAKIGISNFFAFSAFIIVSFGLISVLMAGIFNGFAFPLFVGNYKDATSEIMASLKPVLTFRQSIAAAFEYVYIGSFCLSILFWSVSILVTKKLPLRIGYFGILISICGIAVNCLGVSPASVHGAMLFALCIVIWVVTIAVNLINTNSVAMRHSCVRC
jgi:hypothetical protein